MLYVFWLLHPIWCFPKAHQLFHKTYFFHCSFLHLFRVYEHVHAHTFSWIFESKQVDRNLSQCSSDQSRSTRQKDNELKTNNSWRYKIQRITLETSLPSLEFDFPQYMFRNSCPCVSCLKKICRDYSSFSRDLSCSLSFLMLQFEVIKKTKQKTLQQIVFKAEHSTISNWAVLDLFILWKCLRTKKSMENIVWPAII